MATIDPANLKYYLSGGATNADPNASLGGIRSSTAVSGGLNNLDDVTGDEAVAGTVEYRCVYFRNDDQNTNGLMSPYLWVAANTPSATTTLDIGLDPAGKNTEATTIPLETTAPSGVSFSAPSSKATGIALPSEPYLQSDYIAIWVRRTVNSGTSSTASDAATLRVEGDTI
jgi:hypothetical protein